MQTFGLDPAQYQAARNRSLIRLWLTYVVIVPLTSLVVVQGDLGPHGLWAIGLSLLSMAIFFGIVHWSVIQRLRSIWRTFQITVDEKQITRSGEGGRYTKIWVDLIAQINEYPDQGIVITKSGSAETITIPPNLERYADARAIVGTWQPITSHQRPYIPFYQNLALTMIGIILFGIIYNVRSLPIVIIAGGLLQIELVWLAIKLTRSQAALWLKVAQWALALFVLGMTINQAWASGRVEAGQRIVGRWEGYLVTQPFNMGYVLHSVPNASIEFRDDGSAQLDGVDSWNVKRFWVKGDTGLDLDATPESQLVVHGDALLLLTYDRGIFFFRAGSLPQSAQDFLTLDPQALAGSWVKVNLPLYWSEQQITFNPDGSFEASLGDTRFTTTPLDIARGTYTLSGDHLQIAISEGDSGDFDVDRWRGDPQQFGVIRLAKDELIMARISATSSGPGFDVYHRKR
ncbi:MAG: hypothetical protein HGA65_03570 [Oscillochloris sp.]|nr:hypothetical protein [Oscillochloris sp.]